MHDGRGRTRGDITQADIGGELAICIIDAKNRGQRLAIVTVQESEATKLLMVGKLKIGLVICRVCCRIPLVGASGALIMDTTQGTVRESTGQTLVTSAGRRGI